MKENNTVRKAFIANVVLTLLEIFSVSWMMSGISGGILSAAGLRVLKYFTVDSNIFLGFASFIAAIQQNHVLKGKRKGIPRFICLIKLSATAAVTVTMLVTVFFLEPTMGRYFGYLALFAHSNFFLHLFNPLAAIVTWVCFEKNDVLTSKDAFLAAIPTLLYAIYYIIEVMTHTVNGVIAQGYDWYGFFVLGLKSAVIVIPAFILFTYLVCLVLYRIGKNK